MSYFPLSIRVGIRDVSHIVDLADLQDVDQILQPSNIENAHLQAVLHGRDDSSHPSAPTQPNVCKPLAVDIRTGLQIVDAPLEIFDFLIVEFDQLTRRQVSIKNAPLGVIASFKGQLIDGKEDGTTVLDYERQVIVKFPIFLQVLAGFLVE